MKRVYTVTVYEGHTEWRNAVGQLHREDGPAIEWANGDKSWYNNGERHREDGPAIEWVDGNRWWYTNGLLNRTDGPAVEWPNGDKEWYINGKRLTEKQWRARVLTCADKVVTIDGKQYKLTPV